MHSKYALEFKPSALKEWKKLAQVLQEQFKKKLKQRLDDPHVQPDALSGLVNCYKIKLRSVHAPKSAPTFPFADCTH